MRRKIIFDIYNPWLIFILAILVRLWVGKTFNFCFGYQNQGMPFSDARAYDVLAMNILRGRGYGDYLFGFKYQSFIVPIYPLFLAFIYSFFGHNYFIAKMVQLIISSSTVALTYLITREVFNKKIGLTAGIIMGFYFLEICFTFQLMRECLFIFLITLSVFIYLNTVRHPSLWRIIVCGIVTGITILTRPGGLVLLPVFLVYPFLRKELDLKNKIKLALGTILFAYIAIFPWIMRNYIVHGGSGILLESGGARHFWTGSNPKYGGSFYSRTAWREELWTEPFCSELERNRRLNKEAIEFIKENPSRYLRWVIRRMKFFWRLPLPDDISFGSLKSSFGTYCRLIAYLTVWLGIIGFICSLSLWRKTFPLISTIVLYSISCGIYGATERYRLPIEQFIVIFAAYGLYVIAGINRFDWRRFSCAFVTGKGIQEDIRKGSRVLRFIILPVLISAFIVFIGRLCFIYWFSREPLILNPPQIEQIEKVLDKYSISEKWRNQELQELTYKDVFLDQASNFGAVSKYKGYIVVWTGRVSYIYKDDRGDITEIRLTLNPKPGDFGGEKVTCYRVRDGARIPKGQIKEEDIITVIGQILGEGAIGGVKIDFFDIIR